MVQARQAGTGGSRGEARAGFGRLAALVAICAQLLLGMALPHPPTLADSLADLGAICHAGGGAPGHPAPHDPDCPLCPVCAPLLHQVLLPAPAAALPLRRAGLIGTAAQQPRHAPAPPAPLLAAEPRGPPAEV